MTHILAIVPGARNIIARAVTPPLVVLLATAGVQAAEKQTPIDRHAVVTRHNVTLTSFGVEQRRVQGVRTLAIPEVRGMYFTVRSSG